MVKISTDDAIVSSVTNGLTQSLASLNFDPKSNIQYSQNQSVSDLQSCLSSLNAAVSDFQSSAQTDLKNIQLIHEAIEIAEKNSVKESLK